MYKQKRTRKEETEIKIVRRRYISLLEISLLVLASFAFAFLMSDRTGVVSAAKPVVAVNPTQARQIVKGVEDAIAAGGRPVGVPIDATYDAGAELWISKDGTKNWDNTGKIYGEAVAGGTDALSGTEPFNFKLWNIINLNGGAGYLAQGFVWAGVVYGGLQIIGTLIPGLKDYTQSIGQSAAAGIMAYNVIKAFGPGGFNKAGILPKWVTNNAGWIGLGVGVAVFLLTYKKTKTQTVAFTCQPYEPVLGGKKCEECNKDPFKPCSEYRCKSLGQACQLLNKEDPAKAICAWVGRNDVESPTITPWEEKLTYGLSYNPLGAVRPNAKGVKIINASNADKCLKAFTPLQFGISTNEPAQCKIDFMHRSKFDDMSFYFGENNQYAYNHTQQMKLPDPASLINGSGPVMENDGTFWLYVRCRDANGNVNEDEYAVNFCVDKGPDTTPPLIEGTSITTGSAVQYNVDSVPIELYVNEPAECRWGRVNSEYANMDNNMTCATEASEINAQMMYTCLGNLTGIKNMEENKFYFRCKDQPDKEEADRYVNVESYELMLRGSQPINIVDVAPNGTISGSTSTVNVTLQVQTDDGADEGKALCYFANNQENDSFVSMSETNNYISKQRLDLTEGDYTYYFRCVDSGGNAAETNTTFNIRVDNSAPIVTRVYKEGTDSLKIVTDEDAECTYSLTTCNFNTDEGIKEVIYPSSNAMNIMLIRWKEGSSYYLRCKDNYGNEPSPNQCSIVVGAISLGNE